MLPERPQVPLADTGCPVTVCPQTLGNRLLVRRQAPVPGIPRKSRTGGELSGHQTRPGGRTHGGGIELRETYAPRRQRIHVRRPEVPGTVTVHVQRTMVVRIDHDHVGAHVLRRSRSTECQQRPDSCQQGSVIHFRSRSGGIETRVALSDTTFRFEQK